MQSKNKISLFPEYTRYEDYVNTKRYLRGQRRPEIFPIGENNFKNDGMGKETKGNGKRVCCATITSGYSTQGQGNPLIKVGVINKDAQGSRIYDPDGLACSLVGCSGGHGGKTGLYEIRPCITPCRENKRQHGRRFKENGEPMFTLTGQDQHGVMVNSDIRRLTPTECCFLQGFSKNYTKWGVIKYANAKKDDAIKILQSLQKTIDKIQRKGRGLAELITFLKKEILRQKVYESELLREMEAKGINTTRKLSCQTIGVCDRMQELWEKNKFGYTPQEQEQIGQLIKQLASVVPKLPYKTTSERGWVEYRVCDEPKKEQIGSVCSFIEISDSQRYKCLGNAVSCPIVKLVGEKLLMTKTDKKGRCK